MASPNTITINETTSSPPQASSTSNQAPISKVTAEQIHKAAVEKMHATLAAADQQEGPPQRERILPSERIDLSGRPGFATSGDWPKTRMSSGPIRILSKDGELTEYGKKVERERLAKLATANEDTGDDGEKGNSVAATEESHS